MDMEQEGTRRKVKPVWQIDVCVAIPDAFTGNTDFLCCHK